MGQRLTSSNSLGHQTLPAVLAPEGRHISYYFVGFKFVLLALVFFIGNTDISDKV